MPQMGFEEGTFLHVGAYGLLILFLTLQNSVGTQPRQILVHWIASLTKPTSSLFDASGSA
jgi:hypothetical protein